jgi:hypothetical protein
VKRWLDGESERRADDVRRIMDEYAAIDERIYERLCDDYQFRRAA